MLMMIMMMMMMSTDDEPNSLLALHTRSDRPPATACIAVAVKSIRYAFQAASGVCATQRRRGGVVGEERVFEQAKYRRCVSLKLR